MNFLQIQIMTKYEIKNTTQFKKDYKLAKKRGLNIENNDNCGDEQDDKWIKENGVYYIDDIIHILCEYIKID